MAPLKGSSRKLFLFAVALIWVYFVFLFFGKSTGAGGNNGMGDDTVTYQTIAPLEKENGEEKQEEGEVAKNAISLLTRAKIQAPAERSVKTGKTEKRSSPAGFKRNDAETKNDDSGNGWRAVSARAWRRVAAFMRGHTDLCASMLEDRVFQQQQGSEQGAADGDGDDGASERSKLQISNFRSERNREKSSGGENNDNDDGGAAVHNAPPAAALPKQKTYTISYDSTTCTGNITVIMPSQKKKKMTDAKGQPFSKSSSYLHQVERLMGPHWIEASLIGVPNDGSSNTQTVASPPLQQLFFEHLGLEEEGNFYQAKFSVPIQELGVELTRSKTKVVKGSLPKTRYVVLLRHLYKDYDGVFEFKEEANMQYTEPAVLAMADSSSSQSSSSGITFLARHPLENSKYPPLHEVAFECRLALGKTKDIGDDRGGGFGHELRVLQPIGGNSDDDESSSAKKKGYEVLGTPKDLMHKTLNLQYLVQSDERKSGWFASNGLKFIDHRKSSLKDYWLPIPKISYRYEKVPNYNADLLGRMNLNPQGWQSEHVSVRRILGGGFVLSELGGGGGLHVSPRDDGEGAVIDQIIRAEKENTAGARNDNELDVQIEAEWLSSKTSTRDAHCILAKHQIKKERLASVERDTAMASVELDYRMRPVASILRDEEYLRLWPRQNPRCDKSCILEKLRGRTIYFFGDSHMRIFFYGFLTRLGIQYPLNKVWRGDRTDKISSHDVTVKFIASYFLNMTRPTAVEMLKDKSTPIVVAGVGQHHSCHCWSLDKHMDIIEESMSTLLPLNDRHLPRRQRSSRELVWFGIPAQPYNRHLHAAKPIGQARVDCRNNARHLIFNAHQREFMESLDVPMINSFEFSLAMGHTSLDGAHFYTEVRDQWIDQLMEIVVGGK